MSCPGSRTGAGTPFSKSESRLSRLRSSLIVLHPDIWMLLETSSNAFCNSVCISRIFIFSCWKVCRTSIIICVEFILLSLRTVAKTFSSLSDWKEDISFSISVDGITEPLPSLSTEATAAIDISTTFEFEALSISATFF